MLRKFGFFVVCCFLAPAMIHAATFSNLPPDVQLVNPSETQEFPPDLKSILAWPTADALATITVKEAGNAGKEEALVFIKKVLQEGILPDDLASRLIPVRNYPTNQDAWIARWDTGRFFIQMTYTLPALILVVKDKEAPPQAERLSFFRTIVPSLFNETEEILKVQYSENVTYSTSGRFSRTPGSAASAAVNHWYANLRWWTNGSAIAVMAPHKLGQSTVITETRMFFVPEGAGQEVRIAGKKVTARMFDDGHITVHLLPAVAVAELGWYLTAEGTSLIFTRGSDRVVACADSDTVVRNGETLKLKTQIKKVGDEWFVPFTFFILGLHAEPHYDGMPVLKNPE